MQNILDQKDEA